MGCASSKEAELDKVKDSGGGEATAAKVAVSASSPAAVAAAGSGSEKQHGGAVVTSAGPETPPNGQKALSFSDRIPADAADLQRPVSPSAIRTAVDDSNSDERASSSLELPRPARLRTQRLSRSSYRNLPLPEEWMKGLAGCTHPGIGRAGVNQDAFATHVFRDTEGQVVWLSAVFDGHGPDGEKVAQTCAGRMQEHFEEQSSMQLQMSVPKAGHMSVGNHAAAMARPGRIGGSVNNQAHGNGAQRHSGAGSSGSGIFGRRSVELRIFRDAEELVLHMTFLAMEDEVQEECNAFLSGSTCSACLVKKGSAWLASVGDSASLLVSHGEDGGVSTTVVAPDHRLTNEDELRRVIAAGARVARRPNQKAKGHLRIWLQEADSPGLMVTRSLGDAVGKSVGVSCEPDVMRIKITDRDKFIVTASDGVWDVVSNEAVADIVMGAAGPEEAAQAVVDASLEAWKLKQDAFKAKYGRAPGGIGDNITAVVVDLALWSEDDAA